MQICIYFVLTIVMEQTGVEPVKPKSRKPLILKESSKYNTLQPHNHADNRTEKVFRVAFCTVMQHEYATRNKAARSLLATLTTPSLFVPKVHHMIHPIHLLLPPIARHICAVCHLLFSHMPLSLWEVHATAFLSPYPFDGFVSLCASRGYFYLY